MRLNLGRAYATLERHAEAFADDAPPTKRQGDGEPRVIHPVDQPPKAVGRAQHAAAFPGCDLACQQSQQSALARSIAADDADDVSFVDFE